MKALQVSAPGTRVTTGAAAASVAIPNTAAGRRARAVRIAVGADTGHAHVRPNVTAAPACTDADLVVTALAPVILWVAQYTHIAHLEGTAGVDLVITPLEGI